MNDRTTSAMWREIREQPSMLRSSAALWQARVEQIRGRAPDRPTPVVLGRGSSGNACTFASYLIGLETGRHPVELRPWVATRAVRPADWSDAIAFAFSASGASTDVSAAARWLHERGAHVVSITNAAEERTVLEEVCDQNLRLDAGPERAVPATKSFCAQLFAAASLAGRPILEPALQAAASMEELLREDAGSVLAGFLGQARQIVWLARGPALAAALDGALKVQEAAGLLALAYSTAEFLHGPVASMGPEDRVVILEDEDLPNESTEAVVASLVARRTPVVTVGLARPDITLPVPLPGEAWARVPVLSMLTQLVAMELAFASGLDPDAPPGLKKVTLT